MKKNFILVLITFLLSSCSNKYLRTPAIPANKLTVDDEMAYIEKTDQADRKATLFRLIIHNRKTIKRILYRDSLRLSRVTEFKNANLLQSDSARFSAGIVLFHNGYSKRALYQFNQINSHTKNPGLKANSQTWINICIKDTLRK